MNLKLVLAVLLFAEAAPSARGAENADELASKAGAGFDGSAWALGSAKGALDQADAVAQQTAAMREQSTRECRRRASESGTGKAGAAKAPPAEVPAPRVSTIGALAKAGLAGGMKAAGEAITKHSGLIIGGIVGARAAAMISDPFLAVVVGLVAGFLGAFAGGAASGILGKLAKDHLAPRLPKWVPGSAKA